MRDIKVRPPLPHAFVSATMAERTPYKNLRWAPYPDSNMRNAAAAPPQIPQPPHAAPPLPPPVVRPIHDQGATRVPIRPASQVWLNSARPADIGE